MANNAIKISELNACSAPAATDRLVLVSNVAGQATSLSVSIDVALGNSAANVTSNVVTGATVVITDDSTPSNNTDNGGRANGAIWADGNFIYYWDGTAITRSTLSSF